MDWKAEENRPVTPNQLGTKVYKDYAVKDVVDYIDWNPFFQVDVCSAQNPPCRKLVICLSRSLAQFAYAVQMRLIMCLLPVL